eukprot:m.177256 g.177256  ORF g.177256 m.177256 type:complete len:720 (-) comp14315_c0_seq1:22-2181(-)
MMLATLTTAVVVLATSSHAAMAPPPPPTPPTTPAISFNATLGSYMVLQQAPAIACVYGMLGVGGTGASVAVSGDGTPSYTVQATVSSDGGWKACLKPTPAGGDVNIVATCTGCQNKTVASIEHVVFGDVWYCGGQSNMALPLIHSFTRNQTVDAIKAGKYTNLRLQQLAGNMNPYQQWVTLEQALTMLPNPRHADYDDEYTAELLNQHPILAHLHDHDNVGGGPPCDPLNDTDCSALMSFSAACYYFGESLSDEIANATGKPAPPIGIIHTAWGGSSIEEWLTNETIETCSYAQTSPLSQEFHDTRVMPYLDMTVKGWTWYQGENDMHGVMGNTDGSAGYACMMQALVNQWRNLWSTRVPGTTSNQAPFGIVTLASSGGEGANGIAMGAMRQAQTGGFGVLPNDGMPNTFLAQAYDLDDQWTSLSGGGPCSAFGFNASSPAYHCCGQGKNASLCPPEWAARCQGKCAAEDGTMSFMGGLHPRSKRPVGQRLARACYNTVYGGTKTFTGPTISGCTMSKSTLVIDFNTTLLRGETVELRPYKERVFTPYYPGHGNPLFHGGSQLYVQTVASSFCWEYLNVNMSNHTSPVFCPTWAGGVGQSVTKPAPAGRFPTFGGSGMTPTNDPNMFNEGWINLPITAGPTDTSITVDLTPLNGAIPTAVQYAWGLVDCCDLNDPTIYASHDCIANCPVVASGGLPANPFIAAIKNGKCACVAPQVCDE